MDITIRPLMPEERAYAYTQEPETMQKSGCIGHLRGDMDTNGKGFFTRWDDHTPELKTDAFKTEFDTVVNQLRFDEEILKDTSTLAAYCRANPEAGFDGNYTGEYGFRVDTEGHSYMVRLNPNKGDYNFYIYAYDKKMLDGILIPAPEQMMVIAVEPGKKPYVQEIPKGLESLQKEVGGDIQAIYPYDSAVSIITAESGKLMGMPFNRALRDEYGHIYDVLVGKFLITGLGEENFTSIPDELIPKYSQVFETPEQLVRIGEKNYILPAMDETAVYQHTAAYAREHNELPQYWESLQANIACKEAIEKAVGENYHGWSVDTKTAAVQVMVQFPVERIRYVLAATVQQKDWDGRISDDNKTWAKGISIADEQNRCQFVVDQCHPGLTDLFVKRFREETEMKSSIMERLSESTSKKPSVHKKLKSKEPEL